MTLTLAQMRAKFKEQENRKNKFSEGDKASYPFWDIPVNSTATLRLLPDGGDNDFFWVERAVIRMPFPGVKGTESTKPITVQVPCITMYGKKCPVMQEINDLKWWNGSEEEKKLAQTYYKKRSYLYQGFVVTSPIKEETVPENSIRRLVVNPKLHKIIVSSFDNPEIEDLVIDYENGRDFKVTKTKQGQWDSYDTSQFSFKTRSLNEQERSAIETHGLFDLKSFLPKEPDEKTVALIMEMFEDSVNNLAFDPVKYSAFRPAGAGAAAPTTATASEDDEVPFDTTNVPRETTQETKAEEPTVTRLKSTATEEVASKAAPKKSAQEVLAMLKNKNRA